MNIYAMLNSLLRILFPEKCPLCQKPSTSHEIAPICPECWQTINFYNGPRCERCGRPLVSDVSITCGECLENEPAFTSARSFGLYEGVLKEAINLFKYHGIKRLARPLSRMMARIERPYIDAIVPVPLHKGRLREREFNQSALLARYLSRYLKIPLITDCLIRVKATAPQVGLSARERKRNTRNAFRVKDANMIKKKNIILVDDVITTGATVRECSKILRKAGAGEIHVIALAHGTGE